MAITSSILNRFSTFFHCWKEKYISNKTRVILSTIPSVCCRTTLRKLELRICDNFEQIQYKNRVTFDKNCNVSCHMAKYCHNSCSKCPPFARTHARRRPCHSSIALSMVVWSMQRQTCKNAASVHNILPWRNGEDPSSSLPLPILLPLSLLPSNFSIPSNSPLPLSLPIPSPPKSR